MKKFKLGFYLVILCFVFLVPSCSQKKDPVTDQTETINPNVFERAKEAAEKNPINFFGSNKSSGTFDFLKSNPLWRASLKSLDFIPLASVDYSGGLIITDWYSEKTSDEEIKISIRFLSNELRSDSISIVSHKRICDQKSKCSISLMDKKFNSELKEAIINSAREIALDDKKREKK
ncbi:MAG: DUF3576 domain-containing protein [Candidatus Fonsibacter sp.]|nr:DUF3576 domain-containing protein [Candidatus Fonsibacter sp.]